MTGFRLPPRVHDGAAIAADDLPIPHPGFGIDRLAHGAEQAEAGKLVLSRPLFPPANESPDRGGSCIEDVYLVAIDDSPEAVRLGKVGRAFVHQAGSSVRERAINDVAVPCDPAYIGRTPVSVVLLQIEYPFGGDVGTYGVPAGRMHDAFGLPGCARGIQDEQGVFGIEGLGRALFGSRGHQFVPPVIPAGLELNGAPAAV